MKYYLSNDVDIARFDDNEALITFKDKRQTCVLNTTAFMILDLLLRYDVNEAKKNYIQTFKTKQVKQNLNIEFEDVLNILLTNNIIKEK